MMDTLMITIGTIFYYIEIKRRINCTLSKYTIPLSKTISWDASAHGNALITGARGSGKTFFCFALMIGLATLPNNSSNLIGSGTLPTQFFIIDLKNADMGR